MFFVGNQFYQAQRFSLAEIDETLLALSLHDAAFDDV